MGSRQIMVDAPEEVLLAEKTDEADFGREMKMLAAVKLYELGRLTSGRAAALAGVPRVEFLMSLGHYKVFPFEGELASLERGVADPIAERFAAARWCSVAGLKAQANCMRELVQNWRQRPVGLRRRRR